MILEFRGMPIAFMDLFSLGDGLSIAEKFIDLKMIIIAIGIINRVILEFRGMPIAFMDLFSLGDGLSIAEKFIDLKMIIIAVIVIAVFVAGFIFVWRLDRDKKRFNGIAGISAWLIVVFVSL